MLCSASGAPSPTLGVLEHELTVEGRVCRGQGLAGVEDHAVRVRGLPSRPVHGATGHPGAHDGHLHHQHLEVRAQSSRLLVHVMLAGLRCEGWLGVRGCTPTASSWLRRYNDSVKDYEATFAAARSAVLNTFFGPADKGVFSPSVQFTLMEMGKAVISRWLHAHASQWLWVAHEPAATCRTVRNLRSSAWCRVPEVESIFFNLPNLHFLPCTPVTSKVRNGRASLVFLTSRCTALVTSVS